MSRAVPAFILKLTMSDLSLSDMFSILWLTISHLLIYYSIICSGKPTATAIGTKPRSGDFGACFVRDGTTEDEAESLRVFAARPNGRLWEVNNRAEVYSTHHFSKLIGLPVFSPVTFRLVLESCTKIAEQYFELFGINYNIKCIWCFE